MTRPLALRPNGAIPQRQHGATLIEALVSIVIMSLGLLGIAAIQITAMAFQKTSWSNHRVAETINDFSDRLRANPAGALRGGYLYNTNNYAAIRAATFTPNNCRTGATACTVDQIAADDIAALVTNARANLPGGAVQVAGTVASGFTVTVLFADKELVDSNGTATSAPTCTNSTTGTEWRNCCPTEAAAPAGVRCRRFMVFP